MISDRYISFFYRAMHEEITCRNDVLKHCNKDASALGRHVVYSAMYKVMSKCQCNIHDHCIDCPNISSNCSSNGERHSEAIGTDDRGLHYPFNNYKSDDDFNDFHDDFSGEDKVVSAAEPVKIEGHLHDYSLPEKALNQTLNRDDVDVKSMGDSFAELKYTVDEGTSIDEQSNVDLWHEENSEKEDNSSRPAITIKPKHENVDLPEEGYLTSSGSSGTTENATHLSRSDELECNLTVKIKPKDIKTFDDSDDGYEVVNDSENATKPPETNIKSIRDRIKVISSNFSRSYLNVEKETLLDDFKKKHANADVGKPAVAELSNFTDSTLPEPSAGIHTNGKYPIQTLSS